jgi:hypothetical protein
LSLISGRTELNLLLKRRMSPISYSKDWKQEHDPFNGRVYLCFSIGLKYELLSHQTRSWRWCSKAMYNCIPMSYGKIQIQTINHGYQDCLVPDVFQNIMSKLVQDIEYAKTLSYLDDLLILINSSFKDHLLKLEIVLAWLLTNELLVQEWICWYFRI